MVTLSIVAMMACQILKIQNRDELIKLERSSLASGSWSFPLVYFGLALLGDYVPIAAQIACIYLAIIGNWNELFQSELTTPDDTISINTHMFQDLARSKASFGSQDSFRSTILDKFFDSIDEGNNSSGRMTTHGDSQFATPVSSMHGTLPTVLSSKPGKNNYLPFSASESTILAESARQSRCSTLSCDILNEDFDLKD